VNRSCAKVGRLNPSWTYDKEIKRMKKYAAFAASVAISGAMLVGCGGDDDFCDQATDLASQGSMPSSDELQDLAESAPDEIKDDVQTLVDASGDPANADAAALQEAASNLKQWDKDNC
jgi:hypothetical protein